MLHLKGLELIQWIQGIPGKNAKGKHFRINNKYVTCIVTVCTITHDLFRY